MVGVSAGGPKLKVLEGAAAGSFSAALERVELCVLVGLFSEILELLGYKTLLS